MEKIKEFLKAYRMHILISLLVIIYIGSCSKSRTIKVLNKELKQYELDYDSLNVTIVDAMSESFDIGYNDGTKQEKDRIVNYILKSTKYPLDIKSRNLIVNITNDIENNKHIK